MIRIAGLSVVALTGLLWGATPADAQVFVRAPFVQVETGSGVYVRAPFVRLWIPNGPPPAYVMPAPGPGIQVGVPPSPPAAIPSPANPPVPPPPQPILPAPRQLPAPGATEIPPPQPLQVRYPTLDEFARSFQPRAGNYEVTVISPVTGQPVQVRFSLPEGSPRRVIVNRDEIVFRYNIRQFVRIDFTGNGVIVTSR